MRSDLSGPRLGIPQSDAPVVPEIIVSSMTDSLMIAANGKRHTMAAAGTYYWPDLILCSNYDSIRFEGTASLFGNVSLKMLPTSLTRKITQSGTKL